MGHKRTCACATRDVLQYRSVNLGIACFVKNVSDGAYDCGTLQESLLHAFIHHEIHIALTVSQLRVIELVVCHTVLIFHDGQRLQRLAQQGNLLCMNRNLACLGSKNKTLDADEVTDVKKFLEYFVVKVLIFSRTDLVTLNIHLNTALGVLQFRKTGLTHDAARHHSSGYHHVTRILCRGLLAYGIAFLILHLLAVFIGLKRQILKILNDIDGESIGCKLCCGIWIDSHIPQLLKALSTPYFLFG